MERATFEILSEIEIWHTRTGTPTRRVAIGRLDIPFEPAPGMGGVLISAVLSRFVRDLDGDQFQEVILLLDQIARGEIIKQPRLRYRYQTDRQGLGLSTHRITAHTANKITKFSIDLEEESDPTPQILGALYALERLDLIHRQNMYPCICRALLWRGAIDENFLRYVLDNEIRPELWTPNLRVWALDLLGFSKQENRPAKEEVKKRYRELIIKAHPDSGGDKQGASDSIRELVRARDILSL